MKYIQKYENYINPFDNITNIINEDKYNEIFNLCCSNVDLIKDTPIFRATGLEEDFYLIDPRKMERKSANTKNYYTLMIDNSEKWKEYPKRKHSVICALNDSYMGNEFRVIPLTKYNDILKDYEIDLFGGSKWGVCPEYDIWNSFSGLFANIFTDNDKLLDDFNYDLSQLYTEINNEPLNQLDFNIFKTQLQSIDSIKVKNIIDNRENDVYSSMYLSFFNFMSKMNFNLYDMMDYIFDPIKNGFELKTYNQLKSNHFHNNEVWTDTPVLYVRNQDY